VGEVTRKEESMSAEKNAGFTPGPGEGNREADSHYREAATRHAAEADVTKEAREAADELDKDPDKLAAAEREGKRHAAEEDPELRHPRPRK
jgi:hypothetical protein